MSTRKRNRREMPDPIDDTPENIAAAVLNRPPKDEWRYMEGHTDQTPASNDDA